jgi:putative two-component system response regulator
MFAGFQIPEFGLIRQCKDGDPEALRSDRCYKNGISHEEACEVISQEKGKHFDPEIVDAFLRIKEKIREVSDAMVG